MFYLATILIIAISIVLILIVLVQKSKGGGLASNFSSANQFGGVVQTNKFLEKATWTLATGLLVLSIAASLALPKVGEDQKQSQIQQQINNEQSFDKVPVVPTQNQLDQQLKEKEKTNTENKSK
jgi:preprotein translocase subunit SecG